MICNNIQKIRLRENLTPAEFAEKIKITEQEVLDLELGRFPPSDALIGRICDTFYVSSEWLRDEPFPDDVQSVYDRDLLEFTYRLIRDPDLYCVKHMVYLLSFLPKDVLSSFSKHLERAMMDNSL